MSQGIFVYLTLVTFCLSQVVGYVAASEYEIGPGDLLQVTVYEHPDLATKTRVSTNGKINFPLVGAVALSNLTERQAEDRIAKLLKQGRFVKSPQVTVIVEEHLSHQVSVLGEVSKPGKYTLDTGNTLLDIIALAGGVTDTAHDRIIILKNNSANSKQELDLVQTLRHGEMSELVELEAGDVIFVPRMDVFYIYGEAQRPGSYRLERNMSVMQALAVAGSVTDKGSERGIKIKRVNGLGEVKVLDANLTDSVEPNDVIYIRESWF